jgi:hypothetical protein
MNYGPVSATPAFLGFDVRMIREWNFPNGSWVALAEVKEITKRKRRKQRR